MLMTWCYGAKKNTPLQPHTECNELWTHSQHGPKTGALRSTKSSTTLFTLSTNRKAGKVMLAGTLLKEEDEATYLGVTFDKR